MTPTIPTPALADLPEHRLDYIARQYFADEQYQHYVKHAISDAFKEASRAVQPVAPSPQIAEVAELPPVICVGRPFPSTDKCTVHFARDVSDAELLEVNRFLNARLNNPGRAAPTERAAAPAEQTSAQVKP